MALTVSSVYATASSFSASALPPFTAQTRLLVIAPHPDDETIANGVLIQRVRAAGGAVKIVLLTAGENNPWPQRWLERRLRIKAIDRQRWGQRRHIELGHALQRLDVGTDALQTLAWPDLGVTGVLLHSCAPAVAELAAAIQAFGPDIVAMPSLEDRHPDHGSAHVLTRLALTQWSKSPLQLAYLIHGRGRHAPVIDVAATAEQSLNKQHALNAHRSQMALSSGRMRRLAGRPERYAWVAPGPTPPTSDPVLPWHPPAWLQPLLRLSVVDGATAQTWPWPQAPLRKDGEGGYRLALPAAGGDCPRFARLACAIPSLWIFDRWGWCEL
jgi:N-acetyl-1-D-myo-inositol-2-amino-2-deoxy-alpha-D-glucopyranoside deacetylase